MTWYAQEILLRATPAALQAVRGSALLAPFAYHLHSLQDIDWYLPEHRHGLPQGGLLVIRPVCAAAARARSGLKRPFWTRSPCP